MVNQGPPRRLRAVLREALEARAVPVGAAEVARRNGELRARLAAIDREVVAAAARRAVMLSALPEARRAGWHAGLLGSFAVTGAARAARIVAAAPFAFQAQRWQIEAVAVPVMRSGQGPVGAATQDRLVSVVIDDGSAVRRVVVTVRDPALVRRAPVLLAVSEEDAGSAMEVEAEIVAEGVERLRYEAEIGPGTWCFALGNPREADDDGR